MRRTASVRSVIAQECITRRPDALVRIALKQAFSDGTVPVDLDPLSLLPRLCAAVPPPRFRTVRHVGVLASASKLRPRIVPTPEPPDASQRSPLSTCATNVAIALMSVVRGKGLASRPSSDEKARGKARPQ